MTAAPDLPASLRPQPSGDTRAEQIADAHRRLGLLATQASTGFVLATIDPDGYVHASGAASAQQLARVASTLTRIAAEAA